MNALRTAQAADLPRMMEIIAQAQAYMDACGVNQWQDGYPDEARIAEDIRRQNARVYVEGQDVVAMAVLVTDGEPTYARIYQGEWKTQEPYACIHRLAVCAERRGKGVADAMLSACEAQALAQGLDAVRIDTHRDNHAMQRLLLRNGYVRCGIIYLESGSERIALEKCLRKPGNPG
ncbi:MAG: GNAT family N-acetyltransferase [Christensenellales bacterium]|nr:GNAT family N-acetyltransferase [Christensenellales bacterium]